MPETEHGARKRGALEVLSLNNEFYNADGGRVISDTSFQANNKLYHFECQFSNDPEMAFRMFEYDFHIDLSNAERKNGTVCVAGLSRYNEGG